MQSLARANGMMSPAVVKKMRMACHIRISLERVGIAGLPHKARTQSNVVRQTNALQSMIRPSAVKHQMNHKSEPKSRLWPWKVNKTPKKAFASVATRLAV